MAGARCAAPGCGRFVRRGAVWCPRHREADVPDTTDDWTPPDELAIEFQRRLASGDYRTLFGEALSVAIQRAAEERGLADEIGILRVVLARLLVEERDPAQLAASVSRVAGVAIQAARAQRTIDGEQADRWSELFTQVLLEVDAAAKR